MIPGRKQRCFNTPSGGDGLPNITEKPLRKTGRRSKANRSVSLSIDQQSQYLTLSLHLSRPSQPSVNDLPLVSTVFESEQVRPLSLQENVEFHRVPTWPPPSA